MIQIQAKFNVEDVLVEEFCADFHSQHISLRRHFPTLDYFFLSSDFKLIPDDLRFSTSQGNVPSRRHY
jgi:hypothetical protein